MDDDDPYVPGAIPPHVADALNRVEQKCLEAALLALKTRGIGANIHDVKAAIEAYKAESHRHRFAATAAKMGWDR